MQSSNQGVIFQELHKSMAHIGADRVYYLAKERVCWLNMRKDITVFVLTKCPCVYKKNKAHPSYAVRNNYIKCSNECNCNRFQEGRPMYRWI